jgi:hypothetical protein
MTSRRNDPRRPRRLTLGPPDPAVLGMYFKLAQKILSMHPDRIREWGRWTNRWCDRARGWVLSLVGCTQV